jgi:hypothetical protein
MSKSKTKRVAATLTGILENPIMKVIKDRSEDIEKVTDLVKEWWRYDMTSRKPGPAYVDENFVGTDLDLACFLFELAERNAVINIPQYKSMRASKIKEGEAITSTDNRHGQVIGLTANKDVFSFSVKIKDMNVVTTDGVGGYRNFALTDLDGDWYEGFHSLGFLPTAKENKFLIENKVMINDKIDFTNFVHPNRWSSMFGQYYLITKELIKRLKEEASYYGKTIKEMLDAGITYPAKDKPEEWPESEKIPGKKVKVRSFEVELEVPDNDSEYPTFKHTQKNLVELTNKRKYFTYSLIPQLNFAVRTVEYAYYKFGNDRIPSWIQNVKWENNFVVPGGRKKWDRIILFQDKVGELGISLKKRVYETTQEVSKEYDNRKGKLKNYVAIVLDESGSMGSIRTEVIGAFNQQVETIKANSSDMETLVSLVTFNSDVDKPKLWNQPDSSLKEISERDYQPRGMTALNDAIAMTIEKLQLVEDKDDPTTSFLMIVITDGEENNSKRFPGMYNQSIGKMIKAVQDTDKWTVTFMGANQNIEQASRGLNIARGNAVAFASTSDGMKKASFTVTKGLTSYYNSRRGGDTSVKNFYDDSTKS